MMGTGHNERINYVLLAFCRIMPRCCQRLRTHFVDCSARTHHAPDIVMILESVGVMALSLELSRSCAAPSLIADSLQLSTLL
jgi:hypothetical protein